MLSAEADFLFAARRASGTLIAPKCGMVNQRPPPAALLECHRQAAGNAMVS